MRRTGTSGAASEWTSGILRAGGSEQGPVALPVFKTGCLLR
jgi:hypothetical protein